MLPRVIAVDDDEMFLTAIQTLFSEKQIPLATFTDPEKAMNQLITGASTTTPGLRKKYMILAVSVSALLGGASTVNTSALTYSTKPGERPLVYKEPCEAKSKRYRKAA